MGRLKTGTVRLLLPALINLISIGLSFAFRFLLAKVTGATAFGVFSVWFNDLQLFGLLGMFGQQNHTLKVLAEYRDDASADANRAAQEVLRFASITALLSAAVASMVFFWFQDGPVPLALAQAIAVLTFVPLTILSSIHRSFGSYVIGIMFDRLGPQVLFFVLIALAIGQGSGLSSPEGAYTAFQTIALLISLAFFVYMRQQGPRHFLGRVDFRNRLRDTAPFFLLSLGLNLNGRYILALAGAFYSGPLLGEIGFLLTIVSLILIPGTTLNLVLGPAIARTIAGDQGGPKLRVAAIYAAGCGGSSALAGLVIAFAFPLSMHLIGYTVTLGDGTLWLLVAGAILMALVGAVTFIQQMAGQAQRAVLPLLAVVVVKLIVAVALLRFASFQWVAAADLLLSAWLLAFVTARFWPTIKEWQAQVHAAKPVAASG